MPVFSVPHIKISGLSVTVPAAIEKNDDILWLNEQEKRSLIDTTGIEKRRIANETTTAADLCTKSAENIIRELNWNKNDIDIIVFITQTPDYTIPGTSMFIQQSLGLSKNCLAIDINQGCSGYVYGLSVISSIMSAGKLKRGLLLVGDTITKTINKDDHRLVPIFSDAVSCTLM